MPKINFEAEPYGQTPADKYQSSLDLWAKAELQAQAEVPFERKLSQAERGQLDNIVKDLEEGYFLQELNAFDKGKFFLVLENQNTGEEKRYGFSNPFPLSLPPLENKEKGMFQMLEERTERLKEALRKWAGK